MISKTNNEQYWKTLIFLILLSLILSTIPALIFYWLNTSTGIMTIDSTLIITGLLLFIVPYSTWLYFVFSNIFKAFNFSDKQKIFYQVNKYRKHFQIFYLPISIAIVPFATIVNRAILQNLEITVELIISNTAIPAICFIPSYIVLEFILDRIIINNISQYLVVGELNLFTTLSIFQKYLIISIFMGFGILIFTTNALNPDFMSLDTSVVLIMILFSIIPVISLIAFYFTTEPKFKEINRYLSNIMTEKIDNTTELSITSQDSLGNMVQLYNSVVNRFFGIVRDLKIVQQTVKESEKKYRDLVETSPDWIWEIDNEGKFIYVSPKIKDILGFDTEEVFNKVPLDIMSETEADRLLSVFQESLSNITPYFQIESQIRHKKGQLVWIETRGVPVYDDQGNFQGYRGITKDITENKEMEDELFRKEKLSILGTMSGGIAHEIRNPLGAIKNSAYFLKLKLKNNEDQKVHKHIKIIDNEINRANQIITDLLNFTKVKPPNMENTNLSDLIGKIIESMSIVDEVIKINLNLSTVSPVVFVDQHQISQVLHNLIMNAIEATPKGGEIDIVSEVQENEIHISVKDTGIGIPEENREKIFQPLFTTKGNKGIGLGLALSKQLIMLNGGSITFESIPNDSTTFTIAIPINV
ncbi:MAG: two-component system sensor histidine kinase NtrB [Candidatus Hodarchaeales archaeon]|jgi:PAS domain S-box-containing protein